MSQRTAFAFCEPNSGKLFLLEPGNHLLGRSRRCTITLRGQGVSREHTQMLVSQDGVEVLDLQSTNGTYLNGRLLDGGTTLKHGDILRIGKHRLAFVVMRRTEALADEHTRDSSETLDTTRPEAAGNIGSVLERLEILAEALRRHNADPDTAAAFQASVDDLVDGSGVLFPVLGNEERSQVNRLVSRAFEGSRDLSTKIWQATVMRRLRPVAMTSAQLC
jgi:pSer/pThr/pTyr-binding forkhead associated (FHA) protein